MQVDDHKTKIREINITPNQKNDYLRIIYLYRKSFMGQSEKNTFS
jgi:hypothetical protein